MKKTARLFFVGGLFFIVDQLLKYFSRNIWPTKKLLFNCFGWYPFKNTGVAFSVPLPQFIIITLSLLILLLLVYLLKNSKKNTFAYRLGLILIIFGAASNLIDRILFSYTADYVLILTGVINLADIMIVSGFGLFVFVRK
jgi:lipoprotein signal peptidase